jgi:hypothetical protein
VPCLCTESAAGAVVDPRVGAIEEARSLRVFCRQEYLTGRAVKADRGARVPGCVLGGGGGCARVS